jgi:hypothetical protein
MAMQSRKISRNTYQEREQTDLMEPSAAIQL